MRRDAGLDWEKKLGRGLKSVPLNYAKNSNSLSAECDLFGSFQGLSWRCEAKETSKRALPFSVVSKNQRSILKNHHNSGGYGFIAIRYKGDGAPRGGAEYALPYEDFMEMGGVTERGSVALHPEPDPRLIPLGTYEARDETGKSLGRAVDLRPVLQEALKCHYDRLTGFFNGEAVEPVGSRKSPKRRYLNQPATHRGVPRRAK